MHKIKLELTDDQMGHLIGALEDSLEGLYELMINMEGHDDFPDYKSDYEGLNSAYNTIIEQDANQSPDGLKYVQITLREPA